MKKIMLMSFSILCIVLAVLSYINFSYDGLDVIGRAKRLFRLNKQAPGPLYKEARGLFLR